MAGLNIAEWTTDQVAEWISGLEPKVSQYVPMLRERGLDGRRLLMLRCDDLEYLGMHVIGHQELLLEAVEHLRNFQYECSRECVQQLAVLVSGVATSLARSLRGTGGAGALATSALAELARCVQRVKRLASWLDGALPTRRAALLRLSLEAATCAQRERFAEHPARSVCAAAAATAATADYIIQDVADPLVLQPASLAALTLRAPGKPLGFHVVPSFCGYHQVADIRFGSPAHASGAVHEGDEIVQVNGQCVIGWSGASVERLCSCTDGELSLRLRRRVRAPPHARARPAPLLAVPGSPVAECVKQQGAERAGRAGGAGAAAGASSSDESEPLSPPASPTSPTHTHADHSRMYPVKARTSLRRRYTVCGGSPVSKRPNLPIEQFWQQLKEQHWARGGSAQLDAEPDADALYRRDKAVSFNTGLERSPRPQTCLGVSLHAPRPAPPAAPAAECAAPPAEPAAPPADEERRGKLDKSHSTPAYDFDAPADSERASLRAQIIPESPTTPSAPLPAPGTDAGNDADVSEDELAVGDERIVETINIVVAERRRARAPAAPPPRDEDAPPLYPPLRAVGTASGLEYSPLKPVRAGSSPHISAPLHEVRALPPLNSSPGASTGGDAGPSPAPPAPAPRPAPLSPAGGVRDIFPSSKSRSLKKKSSMLAKRRNISARALLSRGACVVGGEGPLWQRVRARGAALWRWARRALVLADDVLYAFRALEGAASARAACRVCVAGFTASAAGEVRSRAHAFKVYHTGTALYFACASRDDMQRALALLHRATLHAPHPGDVTALYSETEYSETESDAEVIDKKADNRDKDKSKFGSLKKLTHRVQSQESVTAGPPGSPSGPPAPPAAASLDRKYLRFFSRHKNKDDVKANKSKQNVPIPTDHYRSYRRVPASPPVGGTQSPSSSAPAPTVTHCSPSSDSAAEDARKKIPKPINYIHASNPNLLDFEKSDFVTKPNLQLQASMSHKMHKPDSLIGFVTLEQFMLQKQEEERRQLYTERVLLGVRRAHSHAAQELQKQLDRIVADVIYGELPPGAAPAALAPPATSAPPAPPARSVPATAPPLPGKPISVKGKDGYEKIVYPDEQSGELKPEAGYESLDECSTPAPPAPRAPRAPPPAPPRTERPWRESLRRNDKVHTGSANDSSPASTESWSGGVSQLRLVFSPQERSAGASAGGAGSGAGAYPHLQCPPTFTPETYSLRARPAPRAAPPAPPAPATPPRVPPRPPH